MKNTIILVFIIAAYAFVSNQDYNDFELAQAAEVGVEN